MPNLINIEGEEYLSEDLFKEKVFMADSFVERPQKIGYGHGEAKLYLGDDCEELRKFFGSHFELKFFLKKHEVIDFLKSLRVEYLDPTQFYADKDQLPSLYSERMDEVENLDELIWFTLTEQTQIQGRRVYAKSSDMGFKLLRRLSLPGLSFLNIKKLVNINDHENKIFHARLFSDFTQVFGTTLHPMEDASNFLFQEVRVREGQANFRSKILGDMPFCIITKVTDNRLLQAAHIKPFAKCTEDEKYDKMNGLSLTYTMHKLYDLGFISFSENKKLIVSDWLQPSDAQKLNIKSDKDIWIPDFEERNKYLKIHRDTIFKN